MTILIVGGGIGGLASAILLGRLGMSCCVLERSATFEDVGAGIQLSPNAMRVLCALGIADTLRPLRCEPNAVTVRHAVSGKEIFSLPLGDAARHRWGNDYWVVHRADLVAAMRDAVIQEFPSAIASNAEVVSIAQTETHVIAHLSNGETVEGHALVGADGLKSVTRAQIVGDGAPRFTGKVAWRALVPRRSEEAGPTSLLHVGQTTVWAGAGRHVVTYPVRGGALLNVVGVINEADESAESWSRTANPTDFQDRFATPQFAHRDLRAAIANSREVYRWPLYDRAPLSKWSDGRIGLLGDAAHPMLPSMAQGAAMALEDAWVLAAELHQASQKHPPSLLDLNHAFDRYTAARQPRTAAIQRRATRNLDMFHRSGPVNAGLMYGTLKLVGRIAPALLQRQQDWIYAYDVTAIHPAPLTVGSQR
ncbi:MAG: FAD-dependent monooxygenase [Pseudomonadota bacterium]